MIQWALPVDSCLRRNDRIWIWVIDTERGKGEFAKAASHKSLLSELTK
jgi:hypothetical protein